MLGESEAKNTNKNVHAQSQTLAPICKYIKAKVQNTPLKFRVILRMSPIVSELGFPYLK